MRRYTLAATLALLASCATDPAPEKIIDDPPAGPARTLTKPEKPSDAACPQAYEWRCVDKKPCLEDLPYPCEDAEAQPGTCHWMCAKADDLVPPLRGAMKTCPNPTVIWTEPPPPPRTGCPGCGPYQSWLKRRDSFISRQAWICNECRVDADCVERGKKYCRMPFGQRASVCTDNFCAQHRLVRFVPPDRCVRIPGPPSKAPRRR